MNVLDPNGECKQFYDHICKRSKIIADKLYQDGVKAEINNIKHRISAAADNGSNGIGVITSYRDEVIAYFSPFFTVDSNIELYGPSIYIKWDAGDTPEGKPSRT